MLSDAEKRQLIMLKARETGVGWVSAKNSNHFGIAGHYTVMAEEQGDLQLLDQPSQVKNCFFVLEGLVGLACTNGTPWVAATRSRGQRVRSSTF